MTTQTDRDGTFRLVGAGGMVRVRLLGFRSDSAAPAPGTDLTVALEATHTALSEVRVEAARAQGTAVSLSTQRIATNLKTLMVAEEIQALTGGWTRSGRRSHATGGAPSAFSVSGATRGPVRPHPGGCRPRRFCYNLGIPTVGSAL